MLKKILNKNCNLIKLTEIGIIVLGIYILDSLKMSLLQMLSIGIEHLIKNIKLPKVIVFNNEITGMKEYDIIENYEDVSDLDKEYSISNFVQIPHLLVFAILNNNIFLDPNEEESSVASSILIASSFQNKLLSLESIGSFVDIQKIFDVTSIIKSIE